MRTYAWLGILSTVSVLTGCNLVTGADSISIGGPQPDAESGAGAAVGSGTGTSTSGVGGAPSTTGAGGEAPVTTGPQPPALGPADGVAIERISVYQGVERPLVEAGGEVSTDVPVVASRDALLRVFYDAAGSIPVTARLTIDDQVFEQAATVSGSSSDGQLGSTINFDVPAEALTVGADYRVDLLQPTETTSGQNTDARFPTAEETRADLGVEKGGELRVVLVPIAYDADGSGRLPDTSATQLARYEDAFFSMYPVEGVDLEVRNAVTWGSNVSAGGGGWGNLLNAIADLRAQDGADFSTYYYGIFEPASSFANYCSGGCVSGLGFLGGAGDTFARAAIGLGFSGGGSVETAVHELGHNHGREHAPCGGVSSSDGNYPYNGGGIGAWGYDLLTQQLYSPSQFVDVMSYCSPSWISDYNFTAVFDRVRQVASQAQIYVPPDQRNLTYQRLAVGEDGSLEWMSPITLEVPPWGEPASASVETTAGTEQATATFLPYDHLDGGVLLVPPTAAPLAGGISAQVRGALVATP